MRGGIIFFCVLIALPALAALGHDVYLAYIDMEAGKPDPFKLSALGWIWTTYNMDSYQYARDFIDKQTWSHFMEPLLEKNALYVAGIPALVIYGLLIVLRLLHLWPFNDAPAMFSGKKNKNEDSFAFDADIDNKKKGMKYKRK